MGGLSQRRFVATDFLETFIWFNKGGQFPLGREICLLTSREGWIMLIIFDTVSRIICMVLKIGKGMGTEDNEY